MTSDQYYFKTLIKYIDLEACIVGETENYN